MYMAEIITFIRYFPVVILFSRFLYLETVKLGACSFIHNVSCTEFERNALLQFKESLTDPSGRLSSWSGKDCCSWAGVQCSESGRHVTKLKLRNPFAGDADVDGAAYALGGEINPSLLDLNYLKYLDLSMNSFGGIPIPSFIGSLKTLRYLNLSGASFGGSVPPNLGNLTRLRFLDLNNCFDESNGNDLHWLAGLSSLEHLNLGSLDLSRTATYWLEVVNLLPSLSKLHLPTCGLSILPVSLPLVNLTSLQVLDLSNNGFNSSLPPWLFKLSSLVYLNLGYNKLQGEIPDEFAELTFLQHLDLSENSYLDGKLTKNLGKLCSLSILNLSFNKLRGEISDFINALSTCTNHSLESLHLGYNKLSGMLPDSLGKLKNLKRLQLMANSFSGSIPESIGNLSSLVEFYLSENQMKGKIPASLGRLSELVALDLKNNQWQGVITEAHFANLTRLKELSIHQMSRNITLVFSVSSEWMPPFKLKFIELKSCEVGPDFPAWLRNQTELEYVSIWNARISGTIPEWFWKLDLSLDVLDFSYNNLTGTVPNNIKFNPQGVIFLNYNKFTGPLPILSSNLSSYHLDNNLFFGPIPEDFGERMPMLADVDVSFNSLYGTIPSSIRELTSLLTFVVSHNHLTGEIPEVWDTTPEAFVIDLSNNGLSGQIPSSFGSITSLKFLILSNNNLSGEITSSLQNCTLIQSLDLGDNRLSGKIPAWIGENMQSLYILSLRSNLLTGQVPKQLCSLSSLHILDLGENNLSGSIPRCVGNLTGMASLMTDPRYEAQLTVVAKGRDLLYESTLYLVNSIDLSGNNLSGRIPEEMAKLSQLVTLNLSMNHLTGTIPANIASLQKLETLDLSQNELSGTIPSSMASITSLNHLNLSHNNLSGKIPSANQFSTFNKSIYDSNPGLCGGPLPRECAADDETFPSPAAKNEDDEDVDEKLWFYIGLGPGFAAGFWVVCGTLMVKKSWRTSYFQFIDDMKEKLIVAVMVKFAGLKRRIKEKRSH